ncbi:MAG: glycosyltransferase [Chloroflexi bacterium]|nr:glycosyltransferase [Chloroflexota bacterium]
MSKPPKVSINLCCYNSERFLEETLQSVFAQTLEDWELVIVDDGSTDATGQIVTKHVGAGRRIRYHYQPNAGLGAARNRALGLSEGSFIAFIDHDDLWLPTKLAKQVALFEARPELGLVYCDCFVEDLGASEQHRISNLQKLHRGSIFEALLERNFIPLLTAMIRREALDDVGGFRLLRLVEDHELFLRVAAKFPVDFVEEPLARYRFHSGQASRSWKAELDETLVTYRFWLNSERRRDPNVRRAIRRGCARAYYVAGNKAILVADD